MVRNSKGVWEQQVVWRFGVTGNAQTPTGGMVFDTSGNLYVSVSRGGNGGAGVVELSPADGGVKASVLHSFPGPSLIQPYEALVFDSAGNLYSSSYYSGGSACGSVGCGFVYELSPIAGKWKATVLTDFDYSDGSEPIGGVTLDGKGNVYGAAYDP